MLIVTKQLRLELRGFHYKVALNHLNIKCDDEIQGNPYKFRTKFRVNLLSVICNANVLSQCDKTTANIGSRGFH